MASKVLTPFMLLAVILGILSGITALTSTASITSFITVPHISQLIAPGETEVPITLSITNLGNTLYDVNITPLNQYPFKPFSYYEGTQNISIPVFQTGQTINITFIYNIYSNATDGVYKLYYQVSGKLANGSNITKKLSTEIPILGYVTISASSVWGSVSSPLLVAPGENNAPLTIVLVNSGNVIAGNVSLVLKDHYPIKFMQNYVKVGYLPIGQPVSIPVYASVYSNASDGVYNIPIIVKYFNNVTETDNLTVAINGYVNFSVSSIWGTLQSPITVSAGEVQVPLTFVIRNLGDVNALNFSIIIPNEYPIVVSQRSVYVGIIPAGEENYATTTVNVYPNASAGIYYIPVILKYFSNVSMKEYVPIEIYPVNLTVNVITIPPQVFPGYYDVRVEAILLNYGSGIAENVSVGILTPAGLQVVSPNEVDLGAIPTGHPINTTFLINVPNSTSPGYYYVNFTIKYDGGKLIKAYKLQVYPKADLQIVNVYYPSINPGSSKVPITITIKNVGNITAQNIKAILGSSDVIYPHVSSSNPLMGLTASEEYLGDLKPGQEVNITYVVDVSSGAQVGNYSMALTLVWNQTGSLFPFVQNDRFTVQVTPTSLDQLVNEGITFQVGTSKYTVGWLYVIIVVIVIILIVVIAVRLATRRKPNAGR
ncbi:COG1361 S-layer family protein [Stygiolobus caldivivus]|nr:NEW3 domain-containing protein [Stygiolobus caldivivus]